jgi:hypothetical protein
MNPLIYFLDKDSVNNDIMDDADIAPPSQLEDLINTIPSSNSRRTTSVTHHSQHNSSYQGNYLNVVLNTRSSIFKMKMKM